MTMEEIMEAWSNDSNIDRTELGEESLKIPQLHSKYYKMFSYERLKLRKLEIDYKRLYKQKWDYFQGHMDHTELNELGWEPNPLKIIKQDLSLYIDSDNQIIEHNMKTALAKEKVDFLENVIKSLVNRGFNIKSAIDWEKFKVGI
tara:strand:- start:18866 stop:19300 length:435 start_codon:yes stop_codon:yes gene_type:complete